MVDKYKWEPPISLPDGHRLFPNGHEPFKWVAIADDSGREPQSTDDGVLWLDFKRPLTTQADGAREVFRIPLRHEDESQTLTITNAATLLYLSATFNWQIEDQTSKTTYAVTSVN